MGKSMNYYFTGILIILICLLTLIGPAYPGSTQTNTSGSNTTISGSFTALSSSLAARLQAEEKEAPGRSAATVSGSFQGGGSNRISGSSVSTGSFGTVEASNIKVGGGTFTSASLASGGGGGGDGIFATAGSSKRTANDLQIYH